MSARLSFLLAPLLLAGCGGGSPDSLTDEGYAALNSGNYEAASKSFDKALAALDQKTSEPGWLKAKLGSIQARVHLDASKAKTEFLELAAAHPSQVTDSHFNLIGSKLGDAGKLTEAIAVIEAGQKAHPESPHLAALVQELGKKAESSGDTSALEGLKGLGYVGD